MDSNAGPLINFSPMKAVNKSFVFQIIAKNKIKYTIEFSLILNKINISVSDNNSSCNYKASFGKEDFYKTNKYLRQFDSIDEIYDFIIGLNDIKTKTTINVEQKLITLNLCLPKISKGNQDSNILLLIPSYNIKKDDIIDILYEKVKEINILKEKVDFLMKKMCSTCEFELYKEAKIKFESILKNKKDIKESKIIKSEMDFLPILVGLKDRLNKTILDMNLIYRASRDGDSSKSFHTYCDGKENTLIFIKERNGRRFGGFANKEWNSNGKWIYDSNAFLFSLDHYECYFYKNSNTNGKIIYGDESYGPLFGDGYDLYLCDNCLSRKSKSEQSSFDYKGKVNALCGGENFYAEDYEIYHLELC